MFVINAAFAVHKFAALAARPRIASFDLRQPRPCTAQKRNVCLAATTYVGAILCSLLAPSSTETAIANGDTRTLSLHHSHTGESIEATFRVNGSYDPAVLEKLNWFLRDWRNDDHIKMDPRLFDVVWETYRTAGASEPIVIVSAYRSPATNAMLRRRSSGVAEHSQHILGKAMDTTMPGMSMEKVREMGMRLQRGGVGYYGSSNFVHLDVGNVRAWPRMSYDQLARLFPDGKTVHLASNGRALARYEEARAEIASRGGVMSDAPAPKSGNFFAWLFGNRDEDEDVEAVRAPAPRRDRAQVAALGGRRSGAKQNIAADRGDARQEPAVAAAPAPEPDASTNVDRTVVASLVAAPAPRDRPTAAEDREASAAISKDRTAKGSPTSAPLPPPRPQELLAYADVPTPPARPEGLTKVAVNAPRDASGRPATKSDVIGALSAPAAANPPVALARAASLPVVITQGPKDQGGREQAAVPAAVLGYAPSAPQPQRSRSGAPGKDAGQPPQPPVAQTRVERAAFRGPASGLEAAGTPAPSILGQAIMGLRQAARIIPDALSSLPSAGFVTAFRAKASDLDCSRFTDAATNSPAPASGQVSIVESSASPRGN